MIRAGALALTDQCLWSATNFLAVVLFAHVADSEAFGRFALAFSVIVFVSGLAAAASGEVLAVSRGDNRTGREGDLLDPALTSAQRVRAAGVIATLALACPLSVLAIMTLVAGPITMIGLIAAAAAPAAVWAEGMRAMAYAERTPRRAILISGAWILGQGLLTLIAWRGASRFDGTTVLAGWLGGAVLSAVVGAFVLEPKVRFSGATKHEWRRRRSFGFEYLCTAGAMNMTVVLSAGTLGIVDAGAMRALQTVFGPLNILMIGIRNVVVPAAAEAYRGRRLQTLASRVTLAVVSATGFVWLLLVSWPDLGRLIMSENWPSDSGVVSGFSLIRMATAAMFGALVVFRALDATRISTGLRGVSCAALLLPFIAALPFGLESALWAAGCASVAAAGLWWWYARTALVGHST